MSYTTEYLAEAVAIIGRLEAEPIDRIVSLIVQLRERGGRLFVLGVGGSAANASHAVNDFRKIAQLEAYAPTDNVSELTARINDDGWDTAFAAWLRGSRLGARVIGIVGKDGGYTAKVADACVIVPTVNPNNITPHSEAFQAVLWHLFVSHPDLKMNQTKWETVAAKP